MEIDIAEIRLVGDGFTSKELDPTTSLYYGVYPARRVRQTRRSLATEGRSARYYSAWAVEDPAPRGRRWMSVDPLAKKYPGWSPYNYVQDDPTSSIDVNGDAGQNSNQLWQQQPVRLVGPSEIDFGSISAHGFSQPPSNPVAHFISLAANASDKASGIAINSGLLLMGSGLLTGGSTVEAGGALLRGGVYLKAFASGLRFANYEFYGVGNRNKVVSGLVTTMVETFMAGGAHAMEEELKASYRQSATFSGIEEGIQSLFGSQSAYEPPPQTPVGTFQAVPSDVTSVVTGRNKANQ